MSSDAARAAVTVALAPERAFAEFTEGLGSWWPQEYTWSQEVLEQLGIEASEVEVRFEPKGEGTRVAVSHCFFDRHGRGARDYRAATGSPQGWEYILSRFAEHAAR